MESNRRARGKKIFFSKEDSFYNWSWHSKPLWGLIFLYVSKVRNGVFGLVSIGKLNIIQNMGNGRSYIFHFLSILSNRWPLWESVVSANQRKLWFLKKWISFQKFKPKFFTRHSITAKTESTFKQQKKFKLLALTQLPVTIFSKLSYF